MKNIIKYIIGCIAILVISISIIETGKNKISATSLWQIEGTTIVAYNGEESIVTVPEGMTKIGPGAFSSNTKINKVILPESLTEIGMRAFASCTGLSEINLENVHKIGEVAFEGTSISEVTLSDQIKEIPVGCFAYANIKKITLGANVTTIASSAFYNCRTLFEVNLSDCLFSIGSQAFYNTVVLTSIELPEGLMEIGGQAFYGSGLMSIEIPGSVEVLNAGTFNGCTSLNSITFNEGLKEIGGSLIYESNVKKIYIPSTVEEIGTFAFAYAHNLMEITVHENNQHFDSDNGVLYTEGYEKVIMIPYKHPDQVIALHDGAKECEEQFAANLKNVKKIIIPEGFEILNHNAFNNCPLLEEVILPESLEIILSGAFSYCSSLREIKLPSNLKELSNSNWWIGVFVGCSSLKEIVIPDSVEKIGPYTFNDCKNLERVTYPAGLVDFGYKQFSGCEKLEEIIVKEGNKFAFTQDGVYYEIIDGVTTLSVYPAKKLGKSYEVLENVSSIGDHAFDSVANLEEVVIPQTVLSIGTHLFINSNSIKKVTINAPISSLPMQTFANSTIEEVILPSTLKEIENGCFRETLKLKSIELPEGLLVLKNMVFYQSALEEIELPSTVTEINQAFYYATNLKKIKLSNSLTTFEASSFNNCPIEEITIPSSMVEIREYSFVDCFQLQKVNIPDSIATIHASSFYNCPNLMELNISETNNFFVEEDGILYDYDKTKIIFLNKTRLEEVIVLPDTLEEIGQAIFKNNDIIKEITIPSSVKVVNYDAFTNSKIEKAIIGEGTKMLPNFLFKNCTELKEIVFPESLEKMDTAVFEGCTSLESIIIPDTVNIDRAYSLLRDCVNLKYVKLPSTMKQIPQYMLSGCISLETIEIPEGVVEIETHFIQNCNNIKTIVVPSTVTALEYDAFIESGVEKVVFLGNAPVLVPSMFGDNFFPEGVEIYVFKSATGFADKSYKPYIKQFKYITNDTFKDDTKLEVISLGEHQILIDVETIYADEYRYYLKNNEGEYELINESNESSYNYDALLGNKTYEFKVECIIKKGSNEFITSCEKSVFVSKTYEEYMLDYLILEMISLSYKQDPSFEELKYVMDQYYELNEIYQKLVSEQVNIIELETKYNQLKDYNEDINKITDINLSFELGNEIKAGETTKIKVEFPEGVQNKDVSYDVDKIGIIDIKSDGTIYAIKPGTVKITVTALSGIQETIELTVVNNEIEKNNCSGCNQKTIVEQMIMISSISMIMYLIMKRGAKNE